VVRQWRPRLAFEHMEDILNTDFSQMYTLTVTMSVWLPVGTYVFSDLTKPAITIAGVDRFY